MTDPTPATVVGQVKDERPDPPTTDGLYVVVYYFWTADKWLSNSIAADTVEDAERYAQQCIRLGNRNVRIIKIPGEQT